MGGMFFGSKAFDQTKHAEGVRGICSACVCTVFPSLVCNAEVPSAGCISVRAVACNMLHIKSSRASMAENFIPFVSSPLSTELPTMIANQSPHLIPMPMSPVERSGWSISSDYTRRRAPWRTGLLLVPLNLWAYRAALPSLSC